MAEYGVNIAVAVKNSQAVTQLSNKIKETASRIEEVNSRFNTFANVTGKVLPGSIANFNKALSDAAKNLNNVVLNTEEAVTAAKEFNAAQDDVNAALREQKELLRATRQSFNLQTVGGAAFGPQPAKGFNAERGQFETRARLLALETQEKAKAAQKIFNAERQFVDELFAIEMSLSKKARDMEIDNIIKEYELENRLQDTLFRKQIEAADKRAKAFMAELGFKKGEELKAIREVDKARRKAASEAIRLTGQTSPIGGAAGIPGSPAALAAADRARRIRSAQGSALIGGAFPLLFGQGLGAAFGGAAGGFGGGMIGGEFGFGLSLVGTQIGSLIDQLVQNAVDLGAALNPLTASTEKILSAVGKADTEFASLINELEAAGQSALALQLATEELEKVVGVEGVEALEVFSAGIKGLQNDFTIFVTQLSALVAGTINALTGETTFTREVRDRSAAVFEARKKTDNPEIVAAVAELDKLSGFGVDPEDRIAAQEKIVKLLQEEVKAAKDKIAFAAIKEKELTTQIEANELAREARYLLAAQIELAQAGNDLTDEAVVLAKKQVIQETYLAEARGHAAGSQQELLARDNKRLALLQLQGQVEDARLAKQNKELKNAERLDRKQKTAIERAVKGVERQIKQADKAFERASDQLDEIINKNKDKVAFEREYAELIAKGSTPAAAKQQIELKNQLLQLDRQFKKRKELLAQELASVELALVKLKATDATTERIKEQETALGNIREKIEGLSGKKEDAEGAILKALAPRSDREIMQEYLTDLQGQLNDLTNPANQLISLAETVGGAFAESFRGIVDGSMSAQQALANLFQRTANHFLDMAAEMIAAQIKMKILGIGLNFLGGVSGGGISSGSLNAIEQISGIGANTDVSGLIPRANGGAVGAGRPYMVGERGPELFIPGAQGNIVPNHAMGSPNIVVNVDASGSEVQGDQPNAKALGAAIGVAVQAELVKQKRPGGLLA